MKKVALFAFNSTGSIDLLISCALANNLPFDINEIEVVTDNLEYCLRIINSKQELTLIKEKFNIDIYLSPVFIRHKKLIIISTYFYKIIRNILSFSRFLCRINYRVFYFLNFKNINKNLPNFKEYYLSNSLIFVERKNWDKRHINVINTFNKFKIYAFPDAPIRQKDGFTNNSIFRNKKNIILVLPQDCPDNNSNRKIFFEPIPGNKNFYKKIKSLNELYKKRYNLNKSIFVILQKYSEKKNDYDLTNWQEREKIINFLTKRYFSNIFIKSNTDSKIKIILSSHPGLAFNAKNEDRIGNQKTKNLLKSKKQYMLSINCKLSIANSISVENVYSEFSSAIFYFANSNVVIKKGKSYEYYSKDKLILDDYKNFLSLNETANLV